MSASTAFIYDKGYGTFSLSQLRLDPFSLFLFSTKPEEFGPVMELKKQGVSIEEAIEWIRPIEEMVTVRMITMKFLGVSSGSSINLRSQGFSLEEMIKGNNIEVENRPSKWFLSVLRRECYKKAS